MSIYNSNMIDDDLDISSINRSNAPYNSNMIDDDLDISSINRSDAMSDSSDDYESEIKDLKLHSVYCEKEKSPLDKLDIIVNHDIPRLHLMEISPCAVRKPEIREKLINLGMVTHAFSKAEDTIIMANWDKFSKDYGMQDTTEYLDMRKCRSLDQKRAFLQLLGNGLPNRALYQIYQRFIRLCSSKKGAFSEKEDKLILKVVNDPHRPNNVYHFLSRIMKRHRIAINKRYIYLCSKVTDNSKDGMVVRKWSKPLAEALLKSLMKITKAESVNDLKYGEINFHHWRLVEKDLSIPRQKLKGYWDYRLYTQLFAEEPLNVNKIYRKLIKWLRRVKPTTEKEIQWNDGVHLIQGCSPLFLWEMFRRLRKNYAASEFSTFTEFMSTLKLVRKTIDVTDSKFIPRYTVNEDFSLTIVNDF